jgi:hypothetical protein
MTLALRAQMPSARATDSPTGRRGEETGELPVQGCTAPAEEYIPATVADCAPGHSSVAPGSESRVCVSASIVLALKAALG